MKLSKLVPLLGLILASITLNETSAAEKPIKALIVGGGSSHDFKKWFGDADSVTLRELGNVEVTYTEETDSIVPSLSSLDVLLISNNKPFTNAVTRQAITDFVNSGKGLVILHAGMWYSWKDWPEFNRVLVGGGSRAHDRLGEFEVKVTEPTHPIMQGVPASFAITDELYYVEPEAQGTPMKALATAYSKTKDKTYPSVFIVEHPKARVVNIALGHDGRAHDLPPYKQILKNAVMWVARK